MRPCHIIDLMESPPKVPYSGIVNEDVEAPELLYRPAYRLLDMEFICDRTDNGENPALLLFNVTHNPVQLLLSSPCNHNRCCLARKDFCDRLTDTGVASCDDRDLST